jgi:ubiquitin-protein ligase
MRGDRADLLVTDHFVRAFFVDRILVRAYEDRIDLLRALIIGPKDTPYEDAPILIDFFLPPSKYPSEPPLAFFHSWAQGSGRINPNLYVEGKICLSILNTWQGDKNEASIPVILPRTPPIASFGSLSAICLWDM